MVTGSEMSMGLNLGQRIRPGHIFKLRAKESSHFLLPGFGILRMKMWIG